MQLRWFDYWLTGINTDIGQEAPVKICVMGDNISSRAQQPGAALGGQCREPLFHGVGDLVAAVPLPRLHDLTGKLTADNLLLTP